jgi:hypothetical protein
VNPSESVLSADNGKLRMQVTTFALATEPLLGDLPAPLRDLIIYEQAARFEGTVWARGVAGGGGVTSEWRVLAWARGTGFKEWTGRRY